jgi:hypothetical protein
MKNVYYSIAMIMMWPYKIYLKLFILYNKCKMNMTEISTELWDGLQILINLPILFQVHIYKNNIVLIRPIFRID